MSARAQGKEQHRSEGQWRRLLQRFAASGSSVEAFCQREAISAASFYRWRARLASRTKRAVALREDNVPVFIDAGALGTKPAPSARLELKLDLGEGWVLQLVRG